jgi:prevent-host-death family protein
MLDLKRDIHPLTDFKRNTSEFLSQLKATGKPLVLTVNGKAELVVQDAKSYQRLLELSERYETIEAVKEGLASIRRSEGRSSEEIFAELAKELQGPGTSGDTP